MQAEALLDLKDIGRRDVRDKRRHSQAMLAELDIENKENSSNILRRIIIGMTLVISIGFTGFYWTKHYAVFSAIKHVHIEGEFHNEQALSIERALRPHLKGNLVTIDLPAARNALINIDWISEVQLQRSWPNKVVVKIQEHLPVAYWNNSGFVNQQGKIFSKAYSVKATSLPTITGAPERAAEILEKLAGLQILLAQNNMQVSELNIDERDSWKLITKNNIVFYLGCNDIELRLDRFFSVMRSGHAPDWRDIASIDLRHSNGFAVQWHAKQIIDAGREARKNV